MKRAALSILAILVLAGCGKPARQASALQRLDHLGPMLRIATLDSTRVSNDWSRLASSVRSTQLTSVRKRAARLLVDSNRLAGRDGLAEARLRSVRSPGTREVVTRYINDLGRALSAQRWEAWEVERVARLLRVDPFLKDGNDASRLARLSHLARGSASRAVRYARESQALPHRERGLFRYVPLANGKL